MWMASPARREEARAVKYPSLKRAQRLADMSFRAQPLVSIEHETTGELWLRDRGQWSRERAANDPAWLRAQGRPP